MMYRGTGMSTLLVVGCCCAGGCRRDESLFASVEEKCDVPVRYVGPIIMLGNRTVSVRNARKTFVIHHERGTRE
jgi:hypothetical protein